MIEILNYFDLNKRAGRNERSLQAVTRHSDAKEGDKKYMPPSTPSVEESPFSILEWDKKYIPQSSPNVGESPFLMREGDEIYTSPASPFFVSSPSFGSFQSFGSSPSFGESLFSMPEGYKKYMPPSSLGVRESALLRALLLENKTPTELSPPPQMPLWEQLLMYFAMMIGVIFSSAVMQFKSGEVYITSLTAATVLISAIVAFMIAPVVFEKLTVMTDAPLLARLGLFVQHGIFWSFLLGSIP